jgi:hypothetical protein
MKKQKFRKRKTWNWSMDYLRTEHFDQDVDGFMLIMNLQKQLVLFLNLFRKTWVTGTFVCAEDAWKGNMRRIKLLLIKLYTCLLTISWAPIAPFFMDKLYRDLTVATHRKMTVYIWRSFQFRLKTMLIKC